MPFLRVYSNAELTMEHEAFVEQAAALVAGELGKPIGYVVAALGRPQKMSFGGKCGISFVTILTGKFFSFSF